MDKQYSTTWVQPNEMPSIGSLCSKCNKGYLQESQYGGVWCRGCKWKWRVSKYPPKSEGLPKSGAEKEDPILIGLREIYKEIKELREEFKSFVRIFGAKNNKEE